MTELQKLAWLTFEALAKIKNPPHLVIMHGSMCLQILGDDLAKDLRSNNKEILDARLKEASSLLDEYMPPMDPKFMLGAILDQLAGMTGVDISGSMPPNPINSKPIPGLKNRFDMFKDGNS